MTLTGFIFRNALRNRRRLVLTLFSVSLSLFLLAILQVVLRGLTNPEASDEAALRLVVRHKVSLANMLFAKYKPRIEKMPGVAACTKLLWFGGIYQNEKNFFPQFACDAESLFKVMSDARIDSRQLERFIRLRTACVVGHKTMERFGWRVGQRITLLGAMWPCNPELEIVGEFTGGVDESSLYFHHEYLDELLGDQGITGLFWIRADSPASATALVEGIDSEFANSDAETITETEHSFQIGFVSLLGNLKLLIGSICTVIVFTLVLVTGGTMSMTIRERVKEIAILKALGFRGSQVFGLILAESFALALAGGIIGLLAAWCALHAVDLYKISRGMFVNFALTPQILSRTLMVAALLGLVSCVIPGWTNTRRSVVDGLGTVD
jgi:putative ABC transport system permease protein